MPPTRASIFRRLTSLQVALIGLCAIAMSMVLPRFYAFPFAVAILLPWVLALVLIARPRFHYTGLALAAIASFLVSIPLVPFVFIATLIFDSALGSDMEWPLFASIIAMTLLLIVVGIQAVGAAERVPKAERSLWAWPVVLLLTIAYAVILARLSSGFAKSLY